MGRTSDAKERLMTATLNLMWEESYGAVTIDDICQRAGVKKGSFYYFFDSKADLAVAALNRLWEESWRPHLDEVFSPSVEPLDRITGYLESVYVRQVGFREKFGKVLGCPVCSVGSEISTQDEKVGAKVREICGQKRRYFETAIRDAVAQGAIEACDPVEKTASMIALIEGIICQGRIMNDPEIIKHLPAMVLDLLRVKSQAPSSSSVLVLNSVL
jgi:TetR/AcrR family transcriptional repressor of nem operon